MIENYLNRDAQVFFDRINSDANRDWAWRFISIIKNRFPDADHWTTGGERRTYIDIRIGQKDLTRINGYPVFYIRQNSSKEQPYIDVRLDIQDKAENYQPATPDKFNTDSDLNSWLDKYQKLISNEKSKSLSGSGQNPIAYKTYDDGTEPESRDSPAYITKDSTPPPLNQILFGPPGTGKTYATIDETLRILDPDFLNNNSRNRKALKDKFDHYAASDDVRFVTFHQSFSYEDFVEGLRASTNEDKQLEYLIEPGVFKRICEDARTQGAQPGSGIRNNPRIWKISINGTGPSPTKTYCLNNSEARIGWGLSGDLSEPFIPNTYYQSVGSGNQGTLRYFSEEIMTGDILLCIHSAEMIAAIGVVTGEYHYDEIVPDGVLSDYNHVRPVNWLYRDLQLPILPLNDGKQLTLKTVYSMDRFTWGDLLAYLEQYGAKPVESSHVVAKRRPHVLIIDEINRGNISRIFGELITLIEPSKRAGALEALNVTLPYSKRPFSVPANVYLIGTMNTADRSLAGLDIALRRRFIFKEMPPKPELLDSTVVEGLSIGQLLRKMNERIEVLLDRDHRLGHAYFWPLKDEALMENDNLSVLKFIFRQQILPLLQEYFFEDWERIAWVLNDQNKPDGHRFVQKNPIGIAELFGSNVASSLQNEDKLWRINEKAFNIIESYRAIL